MKKRLTFLLLEHIGIVLSLVFITLFIVDRINPAMNFLGNDQSDFLLLIFCIVTLLNSIRAATRLQKQISAVLFDKTKKSRRRIR